jgi:hypothetical protein
VPANIDRPVKWSFHSPAGRLQHMTGFVPNRWSKIRLALVLFGWGPLLLIVSLAAAGLWPDPNPNPIGPAILFLITSWPASICLAIGSYQTRGGKPRL